MCNMNCERLHISYQNNIRDLADDNAKSARDIDKALWGLGHI